MAKKDQHSPDGGEAPTLQGGAYEIIRRRLHTHGADLQERLDRLNQARQEVFGGIPTKLVGTDRILTANNCIPRDMVALGERLLFGFNVQLGLRRDMAPADVFAVYAKQDQSFTEQPLELIADSQFQRDFEELYRYYRNTRFAKFAVIGPHLFMVFRTGREVSDIKAFKWLIGDHGALAYIDNRSDHEYRYPAQHDFEWRRADRDMQRAGAFPHVSIDDRVFVETTGGDLTIKIEDNTASGEGIYAEEVLDRDQTLDDAEIFYAAVGHLILLKIKPYREDQYRHIVFSEKVREARRVDAIAGACVLLPEDHGIIFANGYYLQTGEYKQFESGLRNVLFERRLAAPNGEDFLYVFYNRESGTYVLLSYNIISQRVETPIECHGFCLFEGGELAYLKAQEEPTKSHVVQLWQTPYTAALEAVSDRRDSLLFKIGNRDIVRCMAGCRTLLGLLHREDSYANLYLDITRLSTDLIDSYFWIREAQAFDLGAALSEIKAAAGAAIDEFEKVVQLRTIAADQLGGAEAETRALLNTLRLARHEQILDHVKALADLRALRGKAISLRDLRYIDEHRVQALEASIQDQHERQAHRCVEFLLQDNAMAPYETRIGALDGRIRELQKVAEGEALRTEVEAIGAELEMLIDIVSNLKIDDATQRTAIVQSISGLFATLNQARSGLQSRIRQLASVEGAAEFGSQMNLLSQAVVNYLDICDTPDKCESYLSRVMVQLEELEGTFAAFEDYIVTLAEKREEIHNAFETRRLSLVEARSRRADILLRSADRILTGIRSRADTFKTVEAINGYFASDLMIEKLRGIMEQLLALNDPIKADDVQTRLKSIREDAVRQLHDRTDLFVGGENVIQFGRHRFSVNVQALDLTVVPRGDRMLLHLTGTNFFEAITDQEFLDTQPVWRQEQVSENDLVYRAEYLAYLLLREWERPGAELTLEAAAALSAEALREHVRRFMAPRYTEGYQKGVHDEDATLLLRALLDLRTHIGMLRYPAPARVLAIVFWDGFSTQEGFPVMAARLQGFGASYRTFRHNRRQTEVINELRARLEQFAGDRSPFDRGQAGAAAEYLFDIVAGEQPHPISPEAGALIKGFEAYLKKLGAESVFAAACARVADHPCAHYELVREWMGTFMEARGRTEPERFRDEAAALLFAGHFDSARIATSSVSRRIEGLHGDHRRIDQGRYDLDYTEFSQRLGRFVGETVPRFEQYVRLKKAVIDRSRQAMRLSEFKPRVLTSFVRNRLIDRVYLPLVGDNLAKQIGVVGHTTRTDRSGLLMLISPPGYGKTTLMEYIANRLGLVFMKINGPAIGHQVTSLDPAEAPNAAAREEMHKLGLALEMGDNVMLYVDDIQHCHSEFLQKFISLCDAQRKIEGVYKGQSRTYDLRGKKVAVVMAGNPYTESGEKFRIPDMLANRADTYNLGDILGDNAEAFELSFLENALTSNPALNRLASASRPDVYALIRMAETGSQEGIELEGRYAAEELAEMISVMQKLIRVRQVVLRVNHAYIRSAGQADEFRTEPPFRLQGSYRNMNRLAARVQPIMNDAELETLIFSEYENEAQTLTTGAEANLLKFRELLGVLDDEQAERWAEIKRTFARNQIVRGAGDDDRVGQAVAQLAHLGQGLHDIRDLIKGAGDKPVGPVETALAEKTLDRLAHIAETARPPAGTAEEPRRAAGMSPTLARLLEQQFERLQEGFKRQPRDPAQLQQRLERARETFQGLLDEIGYGSRAPESPAPTPKRADHAKDR